MSLKKNVIILNYLYQIVDNDPLDGNILYAEVRYNDNDNTIFLIKGHGWVFNGKSA
jgi:hypothetical protein